MNPGFAKSRDELPWLPYGKCNRVIINAHNFQPAGTYTPLNDGVSQWFDFSDATTLFDATTGGSLVAVNATIARVEDKSGNSRHATQVTGTRRPTRKASLLNSRDGASFDGGDLLSHTFSINGSNSTVLALADRQSQSGYRYVYQASAASQQVTAWIFARTTAQTQWCGFAGGADVASGVDITANPTVMASRYESGVGFAWWSDGNTGPTSTASVYGGDSVDRRVIGAYGNGNDAMLGNIYEILVWASAVSTDVRQRAEGYLAHKWGQASKLPSGHPYKSAAP